MLLLWPLSSSGLGGVVYLVSLSCPVSFVCRKGEEDVLFASVFEVVFFGHFDCLCGSQGEYWYFINLVSTYTDCAMLCYQAEPGREDGE